MLGQDRGGKAEWKCQLLVLNSVLQRSYLRTEYSTFMNAFSYDKFKVALYFAYLFSIPSNRQRTVHLKDDDLFCKSKQALPINKMKQWTFVNSSLSPARV